MKRIRKIAQSPLFIFILIANFLFVSCTTNGSSEAKTADNTSSQNVSAKEIFNSIIFADGQLTNKIAFIKDNLDVLSTLKTKSEIAEYRKLENEVISYLEKKDSNFLENFKKAMLSKNPSVVLNALNQTSNTLAPFLNSKIASTGLTVEKIQRNPKILNDFQNNQNGNYSKAQCICVLLFAFEFIPGVAIAVALAARQSGPTDIIGKNDNAKAEEFALSIVENI